MSTLLYRQANVEIAFDEASHWLHVVWTGPQAADVEMKRACEQMLLCMIAKRSEVALADFTQAMGFWPGLAEWLAGDWLPRARAKGLRHFAAAFSPDQAEGAAVEHALTTNGVETAKVFPDATAARSWLESQVAAARQAKALTQRLHLRPPVG